MYTPRHAENAVEKLSKMFGAILVAGPRQVGKTTMLKTLAKNVRYVTLDDPIMLSSAREESGTFFKDNMPPVFIDEIQKAPELFPYIKMLLDAEKKKGQFFMCGSQQFKMMKNVSESLAGRIGLVTLLGFSLRETHGVSFNDPFVPSEDYLLARKKELSKVAYDDVWETIHRGSMPELYDNPDYDWRYFYGAYVNTYIERDVRELSEIGDIVKFARFMTAAAASIGSLLNIASLARDVGVSQPTAEKWLSILVSSNIVYLLRPYSSNMLKRAVKTPKLYFLDTGLTAYLTRWNSPEVLKSGAMAGAFFENFVIAEIIKSFYNKGIIDPPLWFYRDRDMNEIDLLLEDSGTIYPLEIKKHVDPDKEDVKVFPVLDKISGIKRGPGGVVCLYDKMVRLKDNDRVIPVSYL